MRTIKNVMLPVLVMLVFSAGLVSAAVTGDCVNCHTMHNSQDGKVIQDHNLTDLTSAQVNLLNSDCLGCHTSATNTIETIGTGNQSKVPIVLTTNEPIYPPTGTVNSVLAGGNFTGLPRG